MCSIVDSFLPSGLINEGMELPIEYSVDGTWYSEAILTSDGLVTPDGTLLADKSVTLRYPTNRPPYPPSEEENKCNGLTSADNACTLSYNWGRGEPVETNIGRCKYHKDQDAPDAPGPAYFSVGTLNAPSTVVVGDVITASVKITNTGEQQDTQTVELRVDTTGDGNTDTPIKMEELTISPGSSTTISQENIDTSQLEPGDYIYGVLTENEERKKTITVEPEPTQTPYPDTTPTLPTRIQAEEYDVGENGEAYQESDDTNGYDLNFRDNPVDVREEGDSKVVGWFVQGEWLEYTINIKPGDYRIRFNGSAVESGKELSVYIDENKISTFEAPVTGDWHTFNTKAVTDITFDEEHQAILRVKAETGGVDFNWIEFAELSGDGSGLGKQGYGEGGFGY